jgi:hypothetical protein
MIDFVVVVGTAFCAWFGSYMGAYMKRKGENLATHEDLGNLVTQMKAVTEATKNIEATISDNVWDRQKQWEMKRDALFELTRSLGAMDDALLDLATAYSCANNAGEHHQESWTTTKTEKLDSWRVASNNFDRARLLALLLCGDEIKKRMTAVSLLIRTVARKIFNGELQAYSESTKEIGTNLAGLFVAIRIELNITDTDGRVAQI